MTDDTIRIGFIGQRRAITPEAATYQGSRLLTAWMASSSASATVSRESSQRVADQFGIQRQEGRSKAHTH